MYAVSFRLLTICLKLAMLGLRENRMFGCTKKLIKRSCIRNGKNTERLIKMYIDIPQTKKSTLEIYYLTIDVFRRNKSGSGYTCLEFGMG